MERPAAWRRSKQTDDEPGQAWSLPGSTLKIVAIDFWQCVRSVLERFATNVRVMLAHRNRVVADERHNCRVGNTGLL